MTATDRFIANLRAQAVRGGTHHPIDHNTLRLLLGVVEKAPKPEPCDRPGDKQCERPVTFAADVPEWGRVWSCDAHKARYRLNEADPLGMAALALEAHLAKRGQP